MTAPAAVLPPKPQVCPANEKTMVIRLIPELAKKIGLNESVMLLQLAFWIGSANTGRFIDGSWWTWQSVRDLQEKVFSYWSLSTINRTIASLVQGGFIIEGNHNEKKYDKTRWFTLNLDNVRTLPGITVIAGEVVETQDTPEANQNEPNVSQIETGSGQNDTRSNHFDTRSTQNETTIPESSSETSTEMSSETKDTTTALPANSEQVAPVPVVSSSIYQIPVLTEVDLWEANAWTLPAEIEQTERDKLALKAKESAAQLSASLFELEQEPVQHEERQDLQPLAAQSKPVESEVSNTPNPSSAPPLSPPAIKLDTKFGRVVTSYHENIGQTISPTTNGLIGCAVDEYPEDWILDAIWLAVQKKKRFWSFVDSTLSNWGAQGYKDLGKFKPPEREPVGGEKPLPRRAVDDWFNSMAGG